ncbi:MAG: hypothetical protein RLZZ301_1214 [Bacteroidota bacterium]|jgi:glycosyltransferase involved in cell wall biosynthesis
MNKSIRICHLTSVHRPDDIRIFHKMACGLAPDFDMHLVVPNGNTGQLNGVHVHSFKAETQNRRIRMKQTVDRVLKEALALKADLYHLHDPELLRIVPALRQTGAKVVFDSHEDVPKQIMDKHWIPWVFRKSISLAYTWYEKRKARQLDGIISVTPGICARFETYHSAVCLVANFPLPSEFKEVDWSSKKPTHFCYIGGLYASRGIREVVMAMKYVNGTLHLAGSFDDPLLQAELESSSAWKKVVFHGHVDRQHIQQILAQCSVGLVTLHPTPSYMEAYPIKLFEYMAGGCAVIASDFPLYRQLIENSQCARFVDPENEAEIAHELNAFVNDPERCLTAAKAARSTFENAFNWDHEAAKLSAFYLQILRP